MTEPQVIIADPADLSGDRQISKNDTTPLAELIAKATSSYSVKDYDAAAELYSQATELQAKTNGEMSPQNADLLYAYGRCLYHLAVKKSDVLGSKVAGERQGQSKKLPSKGLKSGLGSNSPDGQERRVAEEVVAKVAEGKKDPKAVEDGSDKPSQPYFQFTGDENWDTSEEEDAQEDEEDNDEDPEEEDDFVNAYEVLDLARVLLLKNLDGANSDAGQSKVQDEEERQRLRQLKERLADTYDLQAEISLEGERFSTAVDDLKSALSLKAALYPQESSLVAEAHYKLSLALEFSSVTQQQDDQEDGEARKSAQVDDAMREEAATEMEAAVASCKLRIQKEYSILSNGGRTNGAVGDPKATKGDIEEVKEMVKEMEQRLVELRQPPVSINDPTGLGTIDGSNPLSGILGSILGETPAAQKARLEEASNDATDLTSRVKKKKPTEVGPSTSLATETPQVNVKRKVDTVDEAVSLDDKKRLRVSDTDGG